MTARTVILLVALMAVAVFAQNTVAPAPAPAAGEEYTPAIMSKPHRALKKPIIFNPAPEAGTPEADAPIVGAVPANLKKSVVTEHIYGGAVEFEKSRTPQGCRCRRQLPEKYRYDARFKRTPRPVTPCGCPAVVNATNPEATLPPVIARLYPQRNVTVNVTAPCTVNATAPVVTKIAPQYYPKRRGPRAEARRAARLAGLAPCPKNATAAAPATITPSFYPTRRHRRHSRKNRKARRAARKAGKKADRKARREARKARRAAKKAQRKARRAAKKAARDAKKKAQQKK